MRYGAAVSGTALGLFGIATLLATRAANRVTGRAGSGDLILIGSALLAAGASSQSFPGIALAAILVGGASPSYTLPSSPGLRR